MGGTGDIGGGSCHIKFDWDTGGGKENGKAWKYEDNEKPGQQPKYRVVPKGTPNTPADQPKKWEPLPEKSELQVRWD